MNFFRWLFAKHSNNSPDVLGRYPEYMQVRALPERRYVKTSRVLAIIVLINIGITLALAGFYTYLAERVDVSIANQRAVNLFYIDTEQKRLRPAEHTHKSVYAMNLISEAAIRDYIMNRHTILWDNNAMNYRWGNGGLVWALSEGTNIYKQFQTTAEQEIKLSRSQGFVRDVHILELELLYQNLWMGIFDTFDMPIPDSFNPLCDCSDNSQECLDCKRKHAYNHRRYKVFVRSNYANAKSVGNPMGFSIYGYYVLPMVVRDDSFWDTPRTLKPEL